MPSNGEALAPADRGFLLHLQRQALAYFVDNQAGNGLVLDRQSNHGPRRSSGLCSTAATGMGFIALALASAEPYRLLGRAAAIQHIRAGLDALLQLPHGQGMVPHFIDSVTREVRGVDFLSTVETAWVVTGALWAADFLGVAELQDLATHLYERIDWYYWTAPEEGVRSQESGVRSQESGVRENSGASPLTPDSCLLTPEPGLLRHGQDRAGRFLAWSWDRLNGETAFMYVLGAGAKEGRALGAASWTALQPFYGTVAGLQFNNADLGLFVFQYGLDLLDLRRWKAPGVVDLLSEAHLAAVANHQACRDLAGRFGTFRRYWGLSAGDGPGIPPGPDDYHGYAPVGPVDGTAHLTATLASVAHHSAAVLDNLYEAQHDPALAVRGRYGFSNVNVDRAWVSRDVVGIDLGAAVLAVDNFLMEDRVRVQFHSLPCVRRGLERLGFTLLPSAGQNEPVHEQTTVIHRAS
jgi:hypothetical protein